MQAPHHGSSSVLWKAHAKVNLTLAVGAPIPAPSPVAGYHPIASWMACVHLCDDVEITRLGEGRASEHIIRWAPDAARPSPIDWPVEKDLAVRAHRLLEREVGRELPASIRVTKRIPVGGGLGGGSADGAATLLALRKAFELPIATSRLAAMTSSLGSDVAYFIDDQWPPAPGIVSDLGDRVERVNRVEQAIVLVFPPFGCPTGAVYKAFDAAWGGNAFDERATAVQRMAKSSRNPSPLATDELFNDLATPACAVEPRLRELIDRLAGELNSRVHVTGSGSTLFMLASNDEQAAALAAGATRAVPEVAAIPTRLI